MSNSECNICNQIKGQKDGDLLAKTIGKDQPYKRYVIFENSEFIVFPSIGPLVRGHVIVCPKDHFPSYASLSEELIISYLELKNYLIDLLKYKFGVPIHIFEHGNDIECKRVVCTVEHAHMHFVPANVDVFPLLDQSLPWVKTNPNLDSLQQLTEGREYLYYEKYGMFPLISKAGEIGFESQYLRQVFDRALNHYGKWDWHLYPLPQETFMTYDCLVGEMTL